MAKRGRPDALRPCRRPRGANRRGATLTGFARLTCLTGSGSIALIRTERDNVHRTFALLCAVWTIGSVLAADPPQAVISNGQIRAKLYLPDPNDGFYRSTRFDWSGAVLSLEYAGHNFY